MLSVCMSGSDWVAAGIIMVMPMLDLLSDIVYLMQVTFFHPYMFYVAVFTLMLPNWLFFFDLYKRRAWPTFYVPWIGSGVSDNIWWLGFHGGYSIPAVDGVRSSLAYDNHDAIHKFIWYLLRIVGFTRV